MNINIRNIEEKDIEAVVNIQIDGWQTAYKGIIDDTYLKSMNAKERINERKKDYKLGSFIVAESDNKIVGFCRYDDKLISGNLKEYDCELKALYVKSNLKRQGIGKLLFNYAKNDLKSRGKSKMILWCLKENYPSRTFYEKMGGKLVQEKDIKFGDKTYKEFAFGYNI